VSDPIQPLPYTESFDSNADHWPNWVSPGPDWLESAGSDVAAGRGRITMPPGPDMFNARIVTADDGIYNLSFTFDLSEIVPMLTGSDPNIYLWVQLEEPKAGVDFYEIYLDTVFGLQATIRKWGDGGTFSEPTGGGYLALSDIDTSQPISLRIEESGTSRSFRVWQGAEPPEWTFTDDTAPTHLGPRYIDLYINARYEGSPNLYVDDLNVNAVQQFISVGSTAHFTYYYDSDLGPQGAIDATNGMGYAETDVANHFGWFGKTAPWSNGPARVNVKFVSAANSQIPTALAYYVGREVFVNWSETNQSQEIDTPEEYRAVWVHEVAHHFQTLQDTGNWFDYSFVKEAHASFLEREYRRVTGDMASLKTGGYARFVQDWLESPERTDYVNNVAPAFGDGYYLGIGCTLLFLNWLKWQKGYSHAAVTQAGGRLPRTVYDNLTGSTSDPFPVFLAELDAKFPRNTVVDMVALYEDIANPYPLKSASAVSSDISAGVFMQSSSFQTLMRALQRP
jgi:hypothetical protein